jgi:hypothetical protein
VKYIKDAKGSLLDKERDEMHTLRDEIEGSELRVYRRGLLRKILMLDAVCHHTTPSFREHLRL